MPKHMASKNSPIEQLVSQFVSDLEDLFRSQALESVQKSLQVALGGSLGSASVAVRPAVRSAAKSPAAVKPSTVKPKRSKGGRVRRSHAEIEQTAYRILDHVRRNPGQRAEDIKKALNLASNQWPLPIGRLLETKQVRAKGEKRATTYSAV